MQNTAVKTKRKYEKKLINAIKKAGGISLKNKGVNIDFISLTEPKGLYAVDNFDIELIAVEAIMQEVATGEVMLFNQEFGVMRFEFDFVGSKEACYKFLLDEKKRNAEDMARLHVTINGSN